MSGTAVKVHQRLQLDRTTFGADEFVAHPQKAKATPTSINTEILINATTGSSMTAATKRKRPDHDDTWLPGSNRADRSSRRRTGYSDVSLIAAVGESFASNVCMRASTIARLPMIGEPQSE